MVNPNQMNQLVKNKNKFTPVCPVGANNHVDNENEKMLEDTVIKSNSNPESMNSQWAMVEKGIMRNRSENVDGGEDMEKDLLINEEVKDGRKQDTFDVKSFLKEHSLEDIEKILETWIKLNVKLIELYALKTEELEDKDEVKHKLDE